MLERQPRLGGGAMRRVEPRDLARGGCGVLPGKALEAFPGVVGAHGARPTAQEAGLVADAGDPGAARLFGGLRVAAGVRQRFGAMQHGLRHSELVAVALRQCGGKVRVGGDRLLSPTLQQRLIRPVGALGDEGADLVCRRGAWREEAVIGDQLVGDRVGVARGGALGIRPVVGSDRGNWIGLLRQRRCRGEEGEESGTEANRGGHTHLLAQADLAAHLFRA